MRARSSPCHSVAQMRVFPTTPLDIDVGLSLNSFPPRLCCRKHADEQAGRQHSIPHTLAKPAPLQVTPTGARLRDDLALTRCEHSAPQLIALSQHVCLGGIPRRWLCLRLEIFTSRSQLSHTFNFLLFSLCNLWLPFPLDLSTLLFHSSSLICSHELVLYLCSETTVAWFNIPA